jgi:hypothetical protein
MIAPKHSTDTALLLTLTILALGSSPAAAQARSYRHWLSTRADTQQVFTGEVPGGASTPGGYYLVETDPTGRVTRVSSFQDGKKTGVTEFQFSAGARWFTAYDDYAATGEKTGSVKVQRNGKGETVRYDHFTVSGDLTGYSARSAGGVSGAGIEWTTYKQDGKAADRYVDFYSPRGLLIEQQWYPDATTNYDAKMEEMTGLAQSRQKLVNDSLVSSNKYTYDSNGSRTRDDIYGQDGVWYGAREYAGGLINRVFYRFRDSSTKEMRYTYDDKQLTKEIKLSVNGQPICTFTFDRLSDGTVKRTLAVGPDGSLYAEYPNLFVTDVSRQGQALDHPDVAVIHKTGDWW